MLKVTTLQKRVLILIALAGTVLRLQSADTIPRMPAPPGFIDGAAPSDKLRAIGLAGKPESARLLGIYFPTNTLMEILFKGTAPAAPFAKAYVARHYGSIDEAKREFQPAVAKSGPPSNVRYNPGDPTIRKAIETFREGVSQEGSAKMSTSVVLGTIFHNDGSHASCRIGYLIWLEDGPQKATAYAISSGLLLVGLDQLEISIAYPFQDSASITAANQKLLGWIAAIRRQNPEPRP